MKYVGLQSQINSNNTKSILLLLAFPAIILLGIYAFLFFAFKEEISEANYRFVQVLPFIIGGVLVWFLVAYFSHTSLIKLATNARSLSRKENMHVYNLTENLCMSVGMTMPKLYVIDSPALNAFASGIDKNSYAVTLTTGIIDKLNDEELEGVIAHELTHIRNKDVRLLIISIIFVGILSFAVQVLFRSVLYGSHGRRKNKDDGKMVIIALVIAVVVYILSILFKFALSRKREYLADAGAVEMTKNTKAMANALRKISGHDKLETESDDVKQMFIENGPSNETDQNLFSGISGLFATHPPIEKRIAVLEQM